MFARQLHRRSSRSASRDSSLSTSVGEPLGGVERAGRAWPPPPWRRGAAGAAARRRDLGGKPLRREGVLASSRMAPPACSSTAALASWSWSSACGSGTRIAGRPIAASSATVEAPGARDDEMGRRDPRRQVGEERRDLGRDAEPRIGVARRARDPRRAPAARSRAAPAASASSSSIAGGTMSRHDARALAAAEDEQAEARRPCRAAR